MAFIVCASGRAIRTISALAPLGGPGLSTPPPPPREPQDPCIEDGSQGGQYLPDPDLRTGGIYLTH